jgi:molybdenum cofactor cytidylyltransferase
MALSTRTIGAVVLMAGCSNRMPEGNKLLMTLGDTGVSVAERTIQSIVSAGYESILVVTGHDADKLKVVLGDFDLQWTHNSRYKDGMGTSIARAFNNAGNVGSWDAALIVLGDMPFVSVATLQLLREISIQHPNQIIVPSFNGRRGQPVIFPSRFFRQLKECTGDVGGKRILQSHPESVMLVGVGDDAIHWDVDTVEMLNRYVKASQEVRND